MTMTAGSIQLSSGMMSAVQPANSWPERATVTSVVDCRIASAIVRYRVYCVSFAVPDWPSSLSVSNRGITTRSSWMMMLAVMYGMIPSAKTDSCSSAPPLNRFDQPEQVGWSPWLLFATALMQVRSPCS